jgi:uncharacterized membrane protein
VSRKRKQLSRKERELAAYETRQRGLRKARTVVGFLGLVPLAGSFVCDMGVAALCVPLSWYFLMWAGIFGAFVGLTIRLVRERRQFEARSRAG